MKCEAPLDAQNCFLGEKKLLNAILSKAKYMKMFSFYEMKTVFLAMQKTISWVELFLKKKVILEAYAQNHSLELRRTPNYCV